MFSPLADRDWSSCQCVGRGKVEKGSHTVRSKLTYGGGEVCWIEEHIEVRTGMSGCLCLELLTELSRYLCSFGVCWFCARLNVGRLRDCKL